MIEELSRMEYWLTNLFLILIASWGVFVWVDEKLNNILCPHSKPSEECDEMKADDVREKIHKLDLNGKRAYLDIQQLLLW